MRLGGERAGDLDAAALAARAEYKSRLARLRDALK